MIQCQLNGPDEVDGMYVSFVGVPRMGEFLDVPSATPYKLLVTRVVYLANVTGVRLFVEFVA